MKKIKITNLPTKETFTILQGFQKIDDIFICGGFVRDIFLNRDKISDLDIFIDVNPVQLKELTYYLQNYGNIEYGQFGSPRFYPFNNEFKYIDIVPFYNFIVADRPVRDILHLLSNFDITANALAFNLKDQILIDPIGGLCDIQNKRLKAVRTDFIDLPLPGEGTLTTNTVFWFRLLHFKDYLGFNLESNTEKWIRTNLWRYNYLSEFTDKFFEPKINKSTLEYLGIR